MHVRGTLLALVVCAVPASAGTWTVDDDGPAHFSNIQDAIDAAVPGDVIRVFPGLYPNFTLNKALTVVGEPGAIVNWASTTWVLGIDEGLLAVVAGIEFVHSVSVWDCAVPVVLDDLELEGVITASFSSDVRVRGCTTDGLGAFSGSRLEVGESWAIADQGAYGYPFGGPGASALHCDGTSVAHVYRTQLRGGTGGGSDPFNGGTGGDGGNGATIHGEFLLAGDPTHTVQGGGGGHPSGFPGVGLKLVAPAYARVSGVSVAGVIQGAGTSLEQPVPADPALRILAPVGPGGTFAFRLHALPGSTAVLNLGRLPTVQSVPGAAEDLLVVVLRTFDMGAVGPAGTAGFDFTLPAAAATGFTFFAQGRVTLPDGTTRYTNSVPLVVR